MLRQRTATNTYRTMHIASSPARLLDGLYHRLLTDLDDAKRFIESREIVKKAEAINHGLLIIGELNAALDRERAPELCTHLAKLYDFTKDRILSASLSMDSQPLDEARKIIETLRDSFARASGVTR